MSYIDNIAAEIAEACDWKPESSSDRMLVKIYAVLALAKGEDTTCRDVHDAWAATCRPDHKSAVPFEELSAEVQALDEPYRDAICIVGKRLAARRPFGYLTTHTE